MPISKKIAILGATSHIAKGLIYGLHRTGDSTLHLFARSPDRIHEFLSSIDCRKNAAVNSFDSFARSSYDVIINCVGIGDPGKLRGKEALIFGITEDYDNLILDYLESHPSAFYINFSSGAVYGTEFKKPVDGSTRFAVDVNNMTSSENYGIAKLNAEAKHRALTAYNIVDLRIFSYFSRFIDLQSKFLLTEILSCIGEKKIFETGPDNIIRDYVHREDLLRLIEACTSPKTLNHAFDVYSLKPVSKFEILDFFSRQYGLEYSIKDLPLGASPTGSKDHYYSICRKAEQTGYSPQFTSLDCIMLEAKAILGQ